MSFFLTRLASVQMEYLNYGTIFSRMACVEIFRTLLSTISPQIRKIWSTSIELAELWSTWAYWLRWKSMHADHYLFWKINSAYQAPFYCVIYIKMQFFTGYLLVLLFFWGRIEMIQFWGKNPKKLQKNWFFFLLFFSKKEYIRSTLHLRILICDNESNRSDQDTLNNTKKVGCSIVKYVVVKC